MQFKPGYDGKTSISRWLVEAQVQPAEGRAGSLPFALAMPLLLRANCARVYISVNSICKVQKARYTNSVHSSPPPHLYTHAHTHTLTLVRVATCWPREMTSCLRYTHGSQLGCTRGAFRNSRAWAPPPETLIQLGVLAALSLCVFAWAFSSRGTQASHCGSASCSGAPALEPGPQSLPLAGSAAAVRGLQGPGSVVEAPGL